MQLSFNFVANIDEVRIVGGQVFYQVFFQICDTCFDETLRHALIHILYTNCICFSGELRPPVFSHIDFYVFVD